MISVITESLTVGIFQKVCRIFLTECPLTDGNRNAEPWWTLKIWRTLQKFSCVCVTPVICLISYITFHVSCIRSPVARACNRWPAACLRGPRPGGGSNNIFEISQKNVFKWINKIFKYGANKLFPTQDTADSNVGCMGCVELSLKFYVHYNQDDQWWLSTTVTLCFPAGWGFSYQRANKTKIF